MQVCQLGHTIHQLGDLGREGFRDFLISGFGVFDRVVQQSCDDGGIIQRLLGQDRGHFDGMGEIGLAGPAELALMHALPIGIGAPDQVGVGFRVVAGDK